MHIFLYMIVYITHGVGGGCSTFQCYYLIAWTNFCDWTFPLLMGTGEGVKDISWCLHYFL